MAGRSALDGDPWASLQSWVEEAERSGEVRYPLAMCLSTVSPRGRPEGRYVLVEGWGEEGFLFLTDERSPKARSLSAHPWGALTLYWGGSLERQVRVEGRVEPASEEIADSLFERRPPASRAVAWVSRQSGSVPDLSELAGSIAELDRRETDPGRPPHWRAYRLVPDRVELWRARARRVHDRTLFLRRADGGWSSELLLP